MQFLFIIFIFVDFVLSCLIDFIAPNIPKIIKTSKSKSENEFKTLKDRLSLIISITIFIITKKYSGTNALKYNEIFLNVIYVYAVQNKEKYR